MLKRLIIFSILLFIAGSVYAGLLKQPPPLPNEPVSEQHFLRHIYNNWQRAEVRTSDPSNPDEGQFWIIESGSTHQFRWRANETTFSVTGT